MQTSQSEQSAFLAFELLKNIAFENMVMDTSTTFAKALGPKHVVFRCFVPPESYKQNVMDKTLFFPHSVC